MTESLVPMEFNQTGLPGPTTEAVNNVTVFTPFSIQMHSFEHLVITTTVLGLFILVTIIGNVFVIAAVILERNLHNVANYLILSLAVADLMVAVLVLPISVVSEISKVWFLPAEICDMHISFDVLCCTASILHLVAIAMDRYWAVTSIEYIRNRSAKRITIMIAIVWTVAMTISIPPLFGWKDANNDPDKTGVCVISQDHGYTIFSTVCAFYLPMIVMIIIYIRIYQVARARIRKNKFPKKKKDKKKIIQEDATTTTISPKTEYSVVSNCNGCSPENSLKKKEKNSSENETVPNGNENSQDDANAAMLQTAAEKSKLAMSRKEKLELKRERKAARTLAIITGAFIMCWLPFFICALVNPFLPEADKVPNVVFSIVLWLGYLNSLLNPVIYTIFSPEFRNAFRKILFGKYSRER
ncbi:5-hydroxytryptamine receptor-like [Haliotis rufescens]|uniref:5-hydroxytryptamine receptor-like n=1 Tax=Haliotis rufescens TaxID=6454 RepID=UPI001EB0723A|nr:5-hydroxytryptamine receptor-like [Haliotis rufescens]XP_046349994.1 5-hydroxytryptamine receptor-like [Haliotis rufescens]XP_046349995.1 5-hydroxytryptamine receptor-like [Haliotis rufescens]XP_048245588.1 5-hydroxytryptamine receptor-like [Haliotis rufescens]